MKKNRRGTRASFKIKQNEKFMDTSIEQALDEIAKSMNLTLVKGQEIQVPGYSLRPDRVILGRDVVLEADGTVHTSKIQIRKANWRDELLVQAGYRVLHLEGELLVCHNLGDSKRFHPYCKGKIKEFLESGEQVKYLRA